MMEQIKQTQVKCYITNRQTANPKLQDALKVLKPFLNQLHYSLEIPQMATSKVNMLILLLFLLSIDVSGSIIGLQPQKCCCSTISKGQLSKKRFTSMQAKSYVLEALSNQTLTSVQLVAKLSILPPELLRLIYSGFHKRRQAYINHPQFLSIRQNFWPTLTSPACALVAIRSIKSRLLQPKDFLYRTYGCPFFIPDRPFENIPSPEQFFYAIRQGNMSEEFEYIPQNDNPTGFEDIIFVFPQEDDDPIQPSPNACTIAHSQWFYRVSRYLEDYQYYQYAYQWLHEVTIPDEPNWEMSTFHKWAKDWLLSKGIQSNDLRFTVCPTEQEQCNQDC